MNIQAIYSSELCNHVRAIEELSERRVAVVILVEGLGQLAFAFPGDTTEPDAREVLRLVAEAAQNALKSL